MTYIQRFRMDVTCTASSATLYQYVEGGLLYGIGYVPGTASALADGATCYIDFISDIRASAADDVTTHHGMTFVNASAAAFWFPRNKAWTTALASAADLLDCPMIPLANEHIRLVVASGGASGHCHFDFYVAGK